jgi:hypothetical protein
VGGFLIGKVVDCVFVVEDALPLYHNPPVGPILDVGSAILDSSIIGFYSSKGHSVPWNILQTLERIQKEIGRSLHCEIQSEYLGSANYILVIFYQNLFILSYCWLILQGISGEKTIPCSSDHEDFVIDAALLYSHKFVDLESHMDSRNGCLDFRNIHSSS